MGVVVESACVGAGVSEGKTRVGVAEAWLADAVGATTGKVDCGDEAGSASLVTVGLGDLDSRVPVGLATSVGVAVLGSGVNVGLGVFVHDAVAVGSFGVVALRGLHPASRTTSSRRIAGTMFFQDLACMLAPPGAKIGFDIVTHSRYR